MELEDIYDIHEMYREETEVLDEFLDEQELYEAMQVWCADLEVEYGN